MDWSQKLFCVASSWESCARRSRRSLMMERTLTKWSSARLARAAAVANSWLPRRSADVARSRTAFREAAASAASLLEPRSWKSEGACCLVVTVFAAGLLGRDAPAEAVATAPPIRALLPLPLWRPTSFSLALHEGAALDFSRSRASEIAVISAVRVCERWSHRAAFSSHFACSTCWNFRSASRAAVSSLFSSFAELISSVLSSAILLFSSFSFSANFISFFRSRVLLSKVDLAWNSAWSRSFFMSVNIWRRPSRVAMMSLEWYS
mmetsp:Transcript_21030/g.66386  ORF Transcript_21030/g.66386 Transcript_21030/m.66386 type:complete len:264 (+) Transcript_21030:821-1612(+)